MLGTNPSTETGCRCGCNGSREENDSQYWLSKDKSAVSRHGCAESESSLLQAIQAEPFSATPHGKLGALYWKQGRVEDALNSLTRALELDPNNKEAIVNCSMVFRSLGRENDAREVLQAYLAIRPTDYEVRSLLDSPMKPAIPDEGVNVADFMNKQGESQFEQGRLDRARACFEMAIEADPDHWAAHCNLGVVRWEDGDVSAALDHLYTAMNLNPDDPEVLRNCFLVLRTAGHAETAAEVMQFYLQKGFGDEAAWKDYGQLLRQIGASTWSPDGLSEDVAKTYVAMGSALFEAGDRSGAVAALERALKIDSGNAEAYYHLGRVVQEAGDLDAALELLQKGLELDPGHHAAISMLEELTKKHEHEETGAH
jgi:tetratricopeptide (TPR) repeat protein